MVKFLRRCNSNILFRGHHRVRWFFNGFAALRPLPLNVFSQANPRVQWSFDGFQKFKTDSLWWSKASSADILHIYLVYVLAPSGALIAIPTYYWPTTPPHFFRSHRSSTLDFHFLSHYSYIKGNHSTYLLTHEYLMGTTGHHCKILQDSAR